MQYQRFYLGDDAKTLSELVACYQEVFATEPWSEWRRCQQCDMRWGIEQVSDLEASGFMHCGQEVVEFWPADVVEGDLCHELALPDASCWLVYDENRLVGFCHGYAVTPSQLETKLEQPGLAQRLIARFGDVTIGYQDEIGVISEYRGRSIASELFQRRLADFRSLGLALGAVRTMTLPPTVTYQWYSRLGYEVVAKYGDEIGRVVMALPLDQV